jgi:hypothetical protein
VARQSRRLLEKAGLARAISSVRNTPVGGKQVLYYSTGNLGLLDSAVQRWLHTQANTQPLNLA